jgi:hypothetical protein
MVERDNPAGRLWHILNEAKQKGPDKKVRNVWAEIFDLNPEADSQILEKTSLLIGLLIEVKRSIENAKDLNQDLYLERLPRIEEAFLSVRLTDQWKAFDNRLDGTTMLSLKHCSDALSNRSSEAVIEEDELRELRSDVQALIDRILDDSELDPELRRILLDHLEIIRRAIINYKVHGSDGLQEAIKTATGAVYLNRELFEAEKDSDSVSLFWKIIVRIGTLTALVNDANQLAPGVTKLIEG